MNKLLTVLSDLKKASSKEDIYFTDSKSDINTIQYSNQFEKVANKEKIETLNNTILPKEYIDLFNYSDGINLFNTKIDGYDLGFKLQLDCSSSIIYRLNYSSEELLIGHLLDVGALNINLNNINTNKPYLYIFTMEGPMYQNDTFDTWLVKYIETYGREYLPDY